MTSKERVLAAMRRQPVDYVPCSPIFNPLLEQQRVGYRWQFPFGPSEREMAEYAVQVLGTDYVEYLIYPGGKYRGNVCTGRYFPAPEVTSNVWMDGDIIHKVWQTPAGQLHAAVKYEAAWPYGMDIPFFQDHQGLMVEHWIKTEADVECLGYVFRPPWKKEHFDLLRLRARQSGELADRLQIARGAFIGNGLSGALELIGAEKLCMMAIENPGLIDAYLEIDHRMNVRNMEIACDLGADIIMRNGFYETSDFYSPAMLEKFLGRRLREEIATVHQAGKVFSYTINTGVMPILDYLKGLDCDVLLGIDMDFPGADIRAIQAKLGDRKSFWLGPPSQTRLWAKDGGPARQGVREAFEVFGKTGLILSASVSSHSIMPWENTLAMIDEWKKLR